MEHLFSQHYIRIESQRTESIRIANLTALEYISLSFRRLRTVVTWCWLTLGHQWSGIMNIVTQRTQNRIGHPRRLTTWHGREDPTAGTVSLSISPHVPALCLPPMINYVQPVYSPWMSPYTWDSYRPWIITHKSASYRKLIARPLVHSFSRSRYCISMVIQSYL